VARKRMLWQLYPSYLLVTIASVVLVAWYSSNELRSFHIDDISRELEAGAMHTATLVKNAIEADSNADLYSVCSQYSHLTLASTTILDPRGTVIGTSRSDIDLQEDHNFFRETQIILSGYSQTPGSTGALVADTLMYIVTPILSGNRLVAVMETSRSIAFVEDSISHIQRKIALVGIAIAILSAAISLFISRKVSRPLEQLREGARRFAMGDLDTKLRVTGSEEIHALTDGLNTMASELHDRIELITRQRNRTEAILESMSEGVIAVDRHERIIGMNRAASEMIRLDIKSVRGRNVQEVVRNVELQRLISDTLDKNRSVGGELVLRETSERFVEAHVTPLHDSDGKSIGALMVLNDVTRLKQLEAIRRDFVANVSHELKTPITSIKGFVETLLDMPGGDPEELRRFLQIIGKQADRLDAIIEDLLSLSRIEQEAGESIIVREQFNVRHILESASQICELIAASRDITVRLKSEGELYGHLNPALLEQAVVNLIDNAIKYSPEGTEVQVSAWRSDSALSIEVEDHGIGIEKELQDRVFERFFRIDKARNRKLGGTGLGLAIVKHIVLAHSGQVSVKSDPGSGSIFTIVIPDQETTETESDPF